MGEVLFFGKEPSPPRYSFQRRQIHIMLPKGANRTRTGIYKLWFNEKYYIGRSKNIRIRAKHHVATLERVLERNQATEYSLKLMTDFLKENPSVSILKMELLEECSLDMLQEREYFYLSQSKGDPNCLNATFTAGITFDDNC